MASSLRIGAAWWKRDRDDRDYLSISISSPVPIILGPDQRLSLFPNANKTEDRQPDFDVVVLPNREEQAAPQSYQAPAPAPTQRRTAPPGQSYHAQAPEDYAPEPPAPRRQAPNGAPVPARAPASYPARRPLPPPAEDDLIDPFA